MDSGTHLVVGFGLAGLAYLDPVVAADPYTATAVMAGTVLGSQAPDADGLLRLKSNAVYIRNHRGWSHSLPALLLWTALITGLLAMLFPGVSLLHVGKWVLLAVCLHVFSDLFNAYGTQALRPLSEKWVSWNIIHIFDPFIFIAHLIGIAAWSLKLAAPGIIFAVIYGILAVYYAWRTIVHARLENKLPEQDPEHREGDRYTLIPTIHPNYWNVVKRRSGSGFVIGDLRYGALRWVDETSCAEHPAVEASKRHPDIEAFLYFSSYACAELKEHSWGVEVRWIDVRYRYRKNYPFVAVLLMDRELRPLDSYVGWLSDAKLEKKLRLHSQ